MKGYSAYDSRLKNKSIYEFLPANERTDDAKQEKFDPKNPKHKKIYESYLKRQQTLEDSKHENGIFEFESMHFLKRKFGPNFNPNSILEPKDLAEMYITYYSHDDMPNVDKPLLREKFFEAISGGADKFATQLMFIRMLKTMDFIEEKDGKFTINDEKFSQLPEDEKTTKMQLIRTLSKGSRDCEDFTSVYDAAFESAKHLAVLEQTGRKNQSTASNWEDQRYSRKFKEATEDLDPEMLDRVAESKRALEIESQKLAKGFSKEDEKAGKTFVPTENEDMLACDYIKKYLQKKALEKAQGVEITQE